uniref:Ig-like domain-containing protein n=1 Tax=Amphilophus citrinellus TaxID=61819 RepID=A0A3Q0SI86_AMPCI
MILCFLVFSDQQVEMKVEEGSESVILPCKTKPDLPNDTRVEWTRSDVELIIVHVSTLNDHRKKQDSRYRERTKMNEDLLRTGDLSLTLKQPTQRDSGGYICTIYRDKDILRHKVVLQVKGQSFRIRSGVSAVDLDQRTCCFNYLHRTISILGHSSPGSPCSSCGFLCNSENLLQSVQLMLCFLSSQSVRWRWRRGWSLSSCLSKQQKIFLKTLKWNKALTGLKNRTRITEAERRYICEFTLDPNTAHKFLKLSESSKKVTDLRKEHPYPDHPERFDNWPQVLCENAVTGCCYWEVKWGGKVYCYRVVGRNGDTDTSKVAVYVDCPAGTLSFYRVSSDTLIHLHTFTTTFTEPLYPGFGYGVKFNSSAFLCTL